MFTTLILSAILSVTPANDEELRYGNPFNSITVSAFYINPFETTEERLTKLEKELIKDMPLSETERIEIYYQGIAEQIISEFIDTTATLVKF